jgi:hypothetical protein
MLIERNETLLGMLRSTNLTFRLETINYLKGNTKQDMRCSETKYMFYYNQNY